MPTILQIWMYSERGWTGARGHSSFDIGQPCTEFADGTFRTVPSQTATCDEEARPLLLISLTLLRRLRTPVHELSPLLEEGLWDLGKLLDLV